MTSTCYHCGKPATFRSELSGLPLCASCARELMAEDENPARVNTDQEQEQEPEGDDWCHE